MAVFPKPKLIVYIGSKTVFEPDSDHKNSPKGPKKSAKEAPNVAKLKTKRYGCTFKTKVDCVHR